MKKLLLIILSVQTAVGVSNAQKPENIERDSLKIDSMKRSLLLQKDTARINCLNSIAEAYFSQKGVTGQRRSDSAFIYAEMANREAIKTGYKYGEVLALLNLTTCKQFVQKNEEGEKYIRRALQLSTELKEENLIGRSYYLLAGLENPVENYKKAISSFKKANNIKLETEVTTWLCMEFTDKGQYEEGFPYCEKCIQLAAENVKKDSSDWGNELVQWSYYDMFFLYKAAGDYETALEYVQKGYHYAEEKQLPWKMYADMSELYCLMNKPDSALVFWNIWKKEWDTYAIGHQALGNNIRAQIYLKKQQPDSALLLLNSSLAIFNKMGKEAGNIPPIRCMLLKAEAYNQKNDYKKAMENAETAVKDAEHFNYRPEAMDGYHLLSLAYHKLNRDKDAYKMLVKYQSIKDSIQNKQFFIRLNNYKREAESAKKEARIVFLNTDNKIKQQQLKQEATFRNFIIAAFIALVFAGLYIFRNFHLKRKHEKLKQEQKEQEWKLKELENKNKHVELQKKSAQLAMQALRAQMNPHFIFNSLSSINHFILKNEGKTASGYLIRFSRLIRMVLINSQKSLISLSDELEMLGIYLEMERLRFKNSFNYGITFLNATECDNIHIPPLLLQPFCENAIWHGLMNKNGSGRLDIELKMESDTLHCTITDNGIGREKAEKIKSKSAEKQKSMGLKITADRLSLLNTENETNTSWFIEDLKDERGHANGTRVNLKIKCGETMEKINN